MSSAMASREEKKYLYFEIFHGGKKLHTYFSYLLIRGTSLLTCSYIVELRNGRKFKCDTSASSNLFSTRILS